MNFGAVRLGSAAALIGIIAVVSPASAQFQTLPSTSVPRIWGLPTPEAPDEVVPADIAPLRKPDDDAVAALRVWLSEDRPAPAPSSEPEPANREPDAQSRDGGNGPQIEPGRDQPADETQTESVGEGERLPEDADEVMNGRGTEGDAEDETGDAVPNEDTDPEAGAEILPEEAAVSDDMAGENLCAPVLEEIMAENALLFASGSANLTPASETQLSLVATALAQCPDTVVYVEGHTDSQGDEHQNLLLSVARSEAVVDALVALGVDPARMFAVGYGAGLPVADNATSQGRADNRRIVFAFEDFARPLE